MNKCEHNFEEVLYYRQLFTCFHLVFLCLLFWYILVYVKFESKMHLGIFIYWDPFLFCKCKHFSRAKVKSHRISLPIHLYKERNYFQEIWLFISLLMELHGEAIWTEEKKGCCLAAVEARTVIRTACKCCIKTDLNHSRLSFKAPNNLFNSWSAMFV